MTNRRAAIEAGCRTPFARSGTAFRDLTALDLARACVRELLERTEVAPASIDFPITIRLPPPDTLPLTVRLLPKKEVSRSR